jgi:hypothetical protein
MNVRPQVKQRAEEQSSTMTTDQQAAIRVLANRRVGRAGAFGAPPRR